MTKSIDDRLNAIERSLRFHRRLNLALLLLVGVVISSATIASTSQSDFGVIRAKGLVIVDSAGHPRIAIGAPIENVAGRARKDPVNGIIYLGKDGKDRITIGEEPDPMTAKGILPRRSGGVGILVNDKNGVERGGYGVLDDGTALLTLDWPGSGEAVALSSNQAFSGVGLFYKSDIGVYRDSIGMFTTAQNRVFLKITDTAGNERAMVSAGGTAQPKIEQFDAHGKPVEGKP